MAKRIMTVTVGGDLHADLVSRRLEAIGHTMFRLNFESFPKDYDVTLDFCAGEWSGLIGHVPSGDSITIDEIGAVWMRKKSDFGFRSADLPPQEHAHAKAETRHLLLGLLYSLDCYWMSHPLALRAASWKGEQLQRAARAGFVVPPSIATNLPGAASAFMAKHDAIVFKPLSSSSLAASEVAAEDRIVTGLTTTRITADQAAKFDAVAEAPCFFQLYVEKSHELRVTVIGDRVFAARIHSQDDPRTATDWRDMSADIPFEAAELPPAVERRCRELVQSYGLTFGAIDLIVTPGGDHVFLEINPVGQFLFIQELVPEFDLIGAVADCLMSGARRRESGR